MDSKNNYSTHFNYYTQLILKSGLLLDEDNELILMHYYNDHEEHEKQGFTLRQVLLGTASLTSSILILQRKFPMLYLPIFASPAVILAVQRVREMIRRSNQNCNVEMVIEMIAKNSKLNRMICEYFKARNMPKLMTAPPFDPYTRSMKRLIEAMFEEEVNLLYILRVFIRQFGAYVPFLKTHYAYVENIELTDFCSINVKDINDAVIYLQKLCDIYVLLSSNCLACFALTFCPDLWVQHTTIDFDQILDKLIPKMKNLAVNCYNLVNKKFDDVKYYYLNRNQIKYQFKKPKADSGSRLHVSTCNTLVHTTEILEKSQLIFKKLQRVDLEPLTNKENLAKCVADLRGHVFDYYEALDVLHKLYEVNINASRPNPYYPVVRNNHVNEVEPMLEKKDASLNLTEPSEDEEYELYIGANDTSSEGTNYSYIEEQESLKHASLLSQELKHKLKTHAQFVAARKKRGIMDELPEVSAPPKVKHPERRTAEYVLPKPVPDYNHFLNARNLVPPPPPPPLPPIDLGPFGGNIGSPYTVDDFFDAIQAAAKSRTTVEEVSYCSTDE